jgi:ribonuclease P/MRP protein subunit POP8
MAHELAGEELKQDQQLSASLKSVTHALRQPQWTYFHLALIRLDAEDPALDMITARQQLTEALSRFLGLIGTTIDVDILKLEDNNIWVRVPRDTSKAFHEAISSWIGQGQMKYIVKDKDDWLVRLAMGSGHDLF